MQKEPIRVLHIVQRMEAAGVQALLMSLYRNVDRSKVQFDFLTHYTEKQFYDDEIEALGGRIYRFSVREDYNLLLYYRQLECFFKEHKEYRIIHGHMPVLGAIYLSVAKKNGVPIRIAHAHTNKHRKTLKGVIASYMRILYPLSATDFFACSKSAGEYFFHKRDCQIINNAIMVERFRYDLSVRKETRQLLGLENCFVAGHAARFDYHKNHSFLIDVFKEICEIQPESVLLLIGDGELRTAIQKKVKEKGLSDKVVFMGVRGDMEKLYQAMDVFIFPSIYEGLGIVNIEAQASGLLTFCSDAVPEEANISPLYTAIPLSSSAAEWAKIIVNKYQSAGERSDAGETVQKAGYDIKDVAKELQKFYLEKVELIKNEI